MKIYINEKPIILAATADVAQMPKSGKTLLGIYRGKVKLLHQFIDTFEKNNPYDGAIISADDKAQLMEDFQGLFKIVSAAGGVVHNPQGEILMIYRRGSWDLPKGKIDKGEATDAAAVREVCEETGIQNVDIRDFITTTYHTYEQKGKRILKPTYWYNMQTTDTQLIPQTEEDIEQAVWMSRDTFFAEARPIYDNILIVLHQSGW